MIEPVGRLAAVLFCAALAGYLLGSIDFAIVVSRIFYQKDIRTLGSGNAGMTNMLRNFGKKGAVLTLFGDVGKGMLAVFLGRWLVTAFLYPLDPLYGAFIGGIAAVLGHMFPVYFGFKGGKGVAVSGGVILALQPVLALILVVIFLLIVWGTKMVSLGSILGMSLYPVVTLVYCLVWSHKAPVYSTVCSAVIALLVVWMHRENIGRIRAGTEYKFGRKKDGGAGDADKAEEKAKAVEALAEEE